MNNKIPLCDTYEAIMKEIEVGNFSGDDEDAILKNLAGIEIIKNGMDVISDRHLPEFYQHFLVQMKEGTLYPDLLFWSALYFNFTRVGIDTSAMREIINSSEILQKNNND